MARASSGSRSSIRSIDPLMSAKSIVTVLGSPSRISLFSAAARSAAEPTAVVEFFAKLPGTRSESDAPQSPQKKFSLGFSAPHSRQRPPSRSPHLPQNFLFSGFSVPHFVQRSLGSQFVEQRFGVLEVGGVDALGEPVVDFGEHHARFVAASSVAQQSRE